MKLLYSLLLPAVFLCFSSCKKYLDEKPDKALQTPTNIGALQGILDYYPYMNQLCGQAGEIASDNYYLTDVLFSSLPQNRMRNAYLWGEGIFAGAQPDDWQNQYTVVYNANIVLDNLPSIQRNILNAADWDNCKGQALVFRAKSFFEIAQIWTKAFDSTTADKDLGIPLRLTSDFNIPTVRSNVKATYEQIIADLKNAIPLLPVRPKFVFRPSRPAAYGLLARTFLITGDYSQSMLYADSCLLLQNTLLDYNTLNPNRTYPFASLQYTNPEDILHTTCFGGINYNLIRAYGRIDTVLYRTYDKNDLRKSIFFKSNPDGSYYFTGNYNGTSSSSAYNGVAVDEIYLIRAECAARLGNVNTAMESLNALLAKRWKTGTFIPYQANNVDEALNYVLEERRKELVYRTLRFSDIKRLNKKGAGIILKRMLQGKNYELPPNDKRFALPIPDNVIQATGILQN